MIGSLRRPVGWRPVGRRPVGWRPAHVVLRSVVALGPVGVLLAGAVAGGPLPVLALAVAVALGVWCATAPGSDAVSFALVLGVVWWALAVDDPMHPGVLLAAAVVLAVHVAAHVADVAPPEAVLDSGLLRLWALRGVAVLAGAPATWVLVRALDGEPAPAWLWPTALGAVVVAVLAGTVAARTAPAEE